MVETIQIVLGSFIIYIQTKVIIISPDLEKLKTLKKLSSSGEIL